MLDDVKAKNLLNIFEAMELSGYTRGKLYQMIREHKIQSYPSPDLRYKISFDRGELIRYIDRETKIKNMRNK